MAGFNLVYMLVVNCHFFSVQDYMNKAKEYERELRAITLERNKAEATVQVRNTLYQFCHLEARYVMYSEY